MTVSPLVQFLIAAFIGCAAIYVGYISKRKQTGSVQMPFVSRHFETPVKMMIETLTANMDLRRMDSNNMIETHDLRKTFVSKKRGKSSIVEAVKGIDFSVSTGEIFGLLGPNGAGKTTTMRMLSTLLSPTSGTALIGGLDLSENQKEIRKTIGYVSQVGGMQRESTGRENLLLQAKLYGMHKEEAIERVNELVRLLDLDSFIDRKTGTYSGGQRRICDLASGIIHKPRLLFLDEPSTGLDPQNRVQVWEQVKKMHQEEGTTIFVTTHYLEEADALCDRVAIVDQGQIVAIGTPEELKQQIAGDIISLSFESADMTDAAMKALEGNSYIREIQRNDTTLHLYVEKGNENLPTLMNTLHEKNMASTSIALSRPTLDDVFLKLTGRSLRAE
jgi:ABC-2 type transport system ATP-binding protein